MAYPSLSWQYDFGEESLEQYVKDVTIQELSRIACMDLLAEEQEMRLTDAESDLAKKAAKEYFASLSDAEKSYMDVHESDIQEAYASYALAEKLYRTMTEGIDEEVSDDEARVIRVQQIYVTDAGIAKEVQKKLKDGEDFAAVAGTYNEKSKIETTVALVVDCIDHGLIALVNQFLNVWYRWFRFVVAHCSHVSHACWLCQTASDKPRCRSPWLRR